MPTLADLPEELIDRIFSHFQPNSTDSWDVGADEQTDSCTLARLSLVCKDFYRIVQPTLYRAIKLALRISRDEQAPRPLWRLLRTFVERPEIVKLVQSLQIDPWHAAAPQIRRFGPLW